MHTILVTGGAGFIGSNFIPHFIENNPDYHIINLDLLTYAGNLQNISEVENHPRYTFVQGDICDRLFVEELFNKYQFHDVIHFAAESHVDNSISGPEAFIKTNVLGTFNLLDTARKLWMSAPNQHNVGFENARFHHVSTDEVYGTLGETGLFEEITPYAPNSPYSASKAGSDMIVRSYFHTYGMNVVTTNCSNNYGPRQYYEKLIPKTIKCIDTNKKIPLHGDGSYVRDWIYVKDNVDAISFLIESGCKNDVYNVGANNHLTNLDVVTDLLHSFGKGTDHIKFVPNRWGQDLRYSLDTTKISSLGWIPKHKKGIFKWWM